ncbi:hypothetical protein [Kribbella shirazensis]|uniref:Uncharacterized protein n=1 Tax=Kribbella shirazensis TaxID=1105143 RepID=A0A7X5V8T5_9ACTN|nr:hypothetical protein [Kribbella shirazensis]NIK55988.1 hypothetical protein [Kribbella shirazensis]
MRTLKEAWRPGRVALSACLRSLCDGTFYYHHQLSIEPSPCTGGPPG